MFLSLGFQNKWQQNKYVNDLSKQHKDVEIKD